MITEWIKCRMIGSPLHRPAEALRHLSNLPKRLRFPELNDIFQEGPRAHQVIAETVTDGMHCVDVGCHLGSVLSEFTRLSPTGNHTAIEPLPYKAAWLRQRYPQVNVVEAAVSESVGDVDFTWNRSRPGFSSLSGADLNGDLLQRVQVRTLPLDDMVDCNTQVGFLKIDVEGAELLALRSARRILSTDRPTVLFECARRSTNAMGFEVDDVFRVLTDDYNYRVMFLHEYLGDRKSLDLESFCESMVYPFKAFNFVAVPE